MKDTTLKVKGMHCSSCEMLITDAVGELTGVKSASASHKQGTVSVSYDETAQDIKAIKKAIENEGYGVE